MLLYSPFHYVWMKKKGDGAFGHTVSFVFSKVDKTDGKLFVPLGAGMEVGRGVSYGCLDQEKVMIGGQVGM